MVLHRCIGTEAAGLERDVEAAAAPLVYQTAWKALVGIGELEKGESVVVTGASGGVGLAAVQLARGLGATVVALSRSAGKRGRLIEAGAHFTFSPDEADLKDNVFVPFTVKGSFAGRGKRGRPLLATFWSICRASASGRVTARCRPAGRG